MFNKKKGMRNGDRNDINWTRKKILHACIMIKKKHRQSCFRKFSTLNIQH